MKLFRRSRPPRPDLAAALERLDRLAEDSPSLCDAAAIQGAILRAIYRDPPLPGAFDLSPDRARDKLHGGVPLLRGEHVPLDLLAIRALMLDLCHSAAADQQRAPAMGIVAAIEQRALDVAELVSAALDGQADAIRERAAALGIDGELLCTLLRFSLFPALEQLAARLTPLRELAAWRQGYCPTCGSWPLLGEYRGLDQARYLRCGLCATEWQVDRLVCPFCGCRDHQALGYLYIDGDQQNRAATCEQCLSYNKTIATLAAIPAIELAVYDLATIHLDMIAIERGYRVPT